jgi:4'-phosphopantetheinyl transferase
MFVSPNQIPHLTLNQVHIWKVDVLSHAERRMDYTSLLSKDELERANKFRFEKDRLTYITARGVLREMISKYIDKRPSEITFLYNAQSKPYIISDIDLEFNVSHSGHMILLAFTISHPLGVDIEYNKREIELPMIARSFFAQSETDDLLSLSQNEQLSAFYNCWTRKEAFIKAKGGGLSIPLDQFEVSLLPKDRPELKVIRWDQEDVQNWRMQSLRYGTDYTGAVIVHNPAAEFQYFDWD